VAGGPPRRSPTDESFVDTTGLHCLDDDQRAAGSVAVLFLGMGFGVAAMSVVQRRRPNAGRSAAQDYRDERARLEQLDDLRGSGILTRPEFDQLKKRIHRCGVNEQFAAAKRDLLC
jgi:hypothetical protein